MTTGQTLVDETRRHLYSGQDDVVNRISGTVGSGDTSITLKYATSGITTGATISVGLEEIRVWESSGASLSVVERGVNGTTAAAHADLDLVRVRPKFSDFRIFQAINEDLLDLSAPMNGLFQVKTVDVTFNAAVSGYDLTGVTNIINLLELRWKQSGPSKSWPVIREYALGRNFATTEFASSLPLFIYESAYPGLPIRVRYSADFNTLSALTDDVQTVTGLPSTANDLPPLGAAIRLVAPREIKRNFTEAQYDPHRLEEVPPGAVLGSTKGLERLRALRIAAEVGRLQSDWPLYVA